MIGFFFLFFLLYYENPNYKKKCVVLALALGLFVHGESCIVCVYNFEPTPIGVFSVGQATLNMMFSITNSNCLAQYNL